MGHRRQGLHGRLRPAAPSRAGVSDLEHRRHQGDGALAAGRPVQAATHTTCNPPTPSRCSPDPKMKKADPANHPVLQGRPRPRWQGPPHRQPAAQPPHLLPEHHHGGISRPASQPRWGIYSRPGDRCHRTGRRIRLHPQLQRESLPNRAAAPSTGDANGAASDPSLGGLSPWIDALQRQLGLKLEKRNQVPTPVLVIDHIEEQPTDN